MLDTAGRRTRAQTDKHTHTHTHTKLACLAVLAQLIYLPLCHLGNLLRGAFLELRAALQHPLQEFRVQLPELGACMLMLHVRLGGIHVLQEMTAM